MSLKIRLLIMVTIILLFNLAAAGYFIINNARHSLIAEMVSSSELVKGLLVHALPTLRFSNDLEKRLTQIVDSVQDTRGIRARFEDMDGKVLMGSRLTKVSLYQPDAPNWFINVMKTEVVAFRHLIIRGSEDYGYLVIEVDPSDEITKVWQDLKILLILALFFMILILVFIYIALKRGLKPLSELSEGFKKLEQGHFSTRLETSVVKELSPIQIRFNHMATVLQTSREEHRAMAKNILNMQEEEQRDLARELHDEIGPCLFGIRVDLAEIERIAAREKLPDIEVKTTSVRTITSHIQSLIRKMLSRLRPMTLDDLGLIDALKDLQRNWRDKQADIGWEWDLVGELDDLDDTLKVSIYRIIQECITNSVRHANPRHIKVEARREKQNIKIAVTDDGKGLTKDSKRGYGLIGMGERVDALGGRISFDTEEGKGLQVRVLIPLREEDSI